jgi:hypothetical protein
MTRVSFQTICRVSVINVFTVIDSTDSRVPFHMASTYRRGFRGTQGYIYAAQAADCKEEVEIAMIKSSIS